MKTLLLAASLLTLSACSQRDDAPAAVASSEPSGEVIAAPVPTASMTPEPAASDTAASETAAAYPEALSPTGIGAIVVGQALPASLKTSGAQQSDGCQIHPDKALRVYAMTDGKVVARVTAMSGSKVQTARGIAIGATEAAVRKAYPDAMAEPHKYVEAPGKYLDWRPGGGTSGLRFEIDANGRVSAIHAGREPEIEYVEGCG